MSAGEPVAGRAGQVIAAYGRQYLVEFPDGASLLCFPRGKKSEVACGDRVAVEAAGEGRGVIVRTLPRQSLFYRSNEFRQKLIAANVSQVVVVVATEPSFAGELVTRCLVAAHAEGIKSLIVLNKCDLVAAAVPARAALAPFASQGYRIVETSAQRGASELRPLLAGETSLLVGQSGMGKSSLLNALHPPAAAATREISLALDSGKHTTTHARLYRLDAASALIDSPGLQSFSLHHLSLAQIESAFPELGALTAQCRFRDCRHDREPGCAFTAALASGEISPARLAVYRSLQGEVAKTSAGRSAGY